MEEGGEEPAVDASAGPEREDSGPLVLKVCSGPHRGAEMLLERGRDYAIGSGDAADVVLEDPTLQDEHLRLRTSAQRVSVLAADGEVRLGERLLVPGDAFGVGAGNVVTIGETRFVVARRRDLPDLHDEADGAPASGPESVSGTGVDGAAGAIGVAAARRARGLYLGGAFVTFAAFAALVFSQSPQPLDPVGDELPARVEAAVADLSIGSRSVLGLPDGTVRLGGYVASEEARGVVAERVADFGRSVSLQVWSDQGMLDAANRVIGSFGQGEAVRAVSSDRGVVEFRGTVDSESTWTRVLSALHEDVTGMEEVDDEAVATVAERVADVRRALAENFPGTDLTVADAGEEILVRGVIAAAERPGLERLVQRFRDDWADSPRLRLQVGEVREELVELQVRWVSLGENAYLVTEDGSRYVVGGVLDNGYVVEAILKDRLVLSKGGRETEYRL